MKMLKKIVGAAAIAGCACWQGCNPQPATVPQPWQACAKLQAHQYTCENGNPGVLLFDGKGALKLSVAGDNPPQFIQTTKYRPNIFFNPEITVQNGTGISGSQGITAATGTSDIRFDVPMNGAYTIKAWYIEYGFPYPSYSSTGNTATCFNPQTNLCRRWYKMVSLASGTYPGCNSNPFYLNINEQDPTGFIGSCD